ncbi:hypothetical protein LJY25_19115 [Hymenobacter sp. BT175]|uniref:hypothetical protein n=1 Tax=Hymenobacter translucens TaxID=2886507 RepID=UPI001D0E5D6B|nr:hypothetical protein [Hymenobacter translucens]MCC2548566.1 hypothetical protein [Hymenobacter translucens]
MPFEDHAAYLALRTYLDFLLTSSTDQAFSDIPAALRSNLAVFMEGKTVYQNSAGQRMVYAADLAAWANDVVHESGLAIALPLASLSVAELQAATSPPTEC